MHIEELDIPNDYNIMFYRLRTPTLNSLFLPLSGLYNPIDNIESNEFIINNKFKCFDMPNQYINIENLFGLSNYSLKTFINELFEGLLIIVNKSEHEFSIKDLNIVITGDNKENKRKVREQSLKIKLPNDSVTIPPNKSYTIKIKTLIKAAASHIIDVKFHTKSKYYDQQYFKKKQRNIIKEETENYVVSEGVVEFFNSKILRIDGQNPFSINAIFHNSEVNTCYIEIQVINRSSYLITIEELYLTPKKNEKEKIKSMNNLERVKNNKIQNDSKYLTLQTEEQINLLFKIDNPNLFNEEENFLLHIFWMKDFDFIPKEFLYEINNNLNIYNDYYKMTVTEKPTGDIIESQNFKIVINLQTKKLDKKYIISLSQEPIKDQDKTNDREIEIIDIIEKKMELNPKMPSNNFILICKSDILGNVYLPRLNFSLYEGDKNNPIENVYTALLSFNCIPKNQSNKNE